MSVAPNLKVEEILGKELPNTPRFADTVLVALLLLCNLSRGRRSAIGYVNFAKFGEPPLLPFESTLNTGFANASSSFSWKDLFKRGVIGFLSKTGEHGNRRA